MPQKAAKTGKTPPRHSTKQLTLKQSFAIQRKKARSARAIPGPYTNPIRAFFTVPHLVRAVLAELPAKEIIELLTLGHSTLCEGAAILYRHLDLRQPDAVIKGIGDAGHGLGDDVDFDFNFAGTPSQGVGSQQATEEHHQHLIKAARHRQEMYRQSVRSIEIGDAQDVERVFELLTTFPALDTIFDSQRRLVMHPAPTFMIPVALLLHDLDSANYLPAPTFPAEWGIQETVGLTIAPATPYSSAAGMKAGTWRLIPTLRAGAGLFAALHSLCLYVYVPHAELSAFVSRARTLKSLECLPDPEGNDSAATRSLIRRAGEHLSRLVMTPHYLLASLLTLDELFDRSLMRDLGRLKHVEIAIAAPTPGNRLVSLSPRQTRYAGRQMRIYSDHYHRPPRLGRRAANVNHCRVVPRNQPSSFRRVPERVTAVACGRSLAGGY